eukprot:1982864-Karenia_brevis.AAC.1
MLKHQELKLEIEDEANYDYFPPACLKEHAAIEEQLNKWTTQVNDVLAKKKVKKGATKEFNAMASDAMKRSKELAKKVKACLK